MRSLVREIQNLQFRDYRTRSKDQTNIIYLNFMKESYLKLANSVGLFLVILFAICFLWYFIMPAERELHLKLFRIAYSGFSGMNLLGFVFGAIQSYLWGYIGVGIWRLVGYKTSKLR